MKKVLDRVGYTIIHVINKNKHTSSGETLVVRDFTGKKPWFIDKE